MKQARVFAPATVLVLFFVATAVFSQTTLTSGTIKGSVVDPQGAAITDAKISATNNSTATVRTAQSDSNGNFTVAELPVGTYTVKVERSGFKSYQFNNVAVSVSNITNLNARLDIGAVSDSVTVEAAAIEVQTSSAALGEVVNAEQASQLPLNGSNFVQLTLLQPGVSRANNFSTVNKGLIGGVDFSVNGNPVTNNLFLVDGANNNDVGSNRTILTYPSVDSIAEFKMLRSSYGPEYGQASGAVISIVTKGGTNQIHGSLTYAGRNDAVAAEDYFAKIANASVRAAGGSLRNNGKDELRRNDITYAIGGPVKKNKLFFYWSQEFNREIQGYTRESCVPTAAEYAGDFSQGFTGGKDQCGASQPTIPVANQAPGNPFKLASVSPAAALLLKQYPTANAVASASNNFNNWFLSTPSPLMFREENARVDYDLTPTQILTFRYTQDHWNNNSPNLGPNGYLWGEDPFPGIEANWAQPSKSAIAKLTSAFGTSLTNEAQFSYSGNAIITTVGGTNASLATQLDTAIPSIFPNSGKLAGGIPTFWGGAFAPYLNNGNLWSIAPYTNNMDLYTVRDDISKIRGNHSFKVGVYLSFNAKNENEYGGQDRQVLGSAADWNVDWGTHTGNYLANFLLPGQVFHGVAEQNINPTDQGRWRDYEWYFGDSWKVHPRFTVEYGFRWSFLRAPYDATDAVGIFNPADYNPATAFITVNGTQQPNLCDGLDVVPGTTFCAQAAKISGIPYTNGTPSKYGRALVPNNNHDIAPRLGIAWDIFGDGKTALRAGAGQFFQRERVSMQVGLSNAVPFAVTATSNRTLDAVPAASAITYGGSSSNSVIPTTNTPNSWQWNLSLERELFKNTTLEVGYVGNKGIHLTSIFDLNAVLPANRAITTGGNYSNCLGNGGTILCNPTFAGLSSNTAGVTNASRPYPSLGSIYTGARNGWSTYHALQALFRTRFQNIVMLQTSYTWSHSISNVDLAASNGLGSNASNITDPFNPNSDKGNSTINRPQMFVANAIWYLPRMTNANALARGVLGGWELSTVASLQSGNSITAWAASAAGINGPSNGFFGTGFAGNNRPLIVPGQSCNAGASGAQIINPNAFTLNGFVIGSYNNPLLEPRGWCHGPSMRDVDLALYKNFKLTERFNLQLRLDGFNALNHANFRGDQINLDFAGNATASCGANPCSPTNPTISSSKLNLGNHFGQATGDMGPRQIQYGLRLTF